MPSDDGWTVRLPGSIKSAIDQQASEDFLPPPDYVRALVQRVVVERQLKRGQRDDNKR